MPGKSLEVLKGAERTVKGARAVYLTVQPAYLDEPDSDLRALLAWLHARGFVVDVADGGNDVAKNAANDSVIHWLTQRLVFSLVAWHDLSERSAHAPIPFVGPHVPGCAWGHSWHAEEEAETS